MKKLTFILAATATTLVASHFAFAAEPVEQTVAFGTAGRYVSAVAKGGLNTKSSKIAGNQTFVLIDLNGGELADGDSVQIKWGSNRSTYWGEGENSIGRYGGKPNETRTFVIKIQGDAAEGAPKSVTLKTASGKWVTVPTKGAALAVTEKEEEATALTIEKIEKTGTDADKETE